MDFGSKRAQAPSSSELHTEGEGSLLLGPGEAQETGAALGAALLCQHPVGSYLRISRLILF